MKKIKGFDLRGLNNGAHFQFMKAVTEQLATETEINKNAVAKAAVEALAAKFKAEDECLSISQKNAESDAIAENDALRDALFMGYKKAVGSYVKFPVAEKAKASKTLMQRIKDYKIDPDMQLERETGLITNLVADCEGKDAAAVALLNLTDYVAQLKAANAKVESLIKARSMAKAPQVAGALKQARRASDEAYRRVVEVINALVSLGMAEGFDTFILYLNETITRNEQEVLPKKKPSEDKKPGDGKPGDGKKPGDKKPGDGGKTPDGKKPGGDAAKPGDGGDGKDKPGDGKDKPGGKGQGDATVTPKE